MWLRFVCVASFIWTMGSPVHAANAPLDGSVDFQGHRGARGLSPENTIASFRDCLKHGITTIELDTTLTKDNQLIVHHDMYTNPTLCQSRTGGTIEKLRIRDVLTEDLQVLDCGGRENPNFRDQRLAPGSNLITLPEFFEFVKGYEVEHPQEQPRFNIEIKVDDSFTEDELQVSAEVMVNAVKAAGMEARTTVQSFDLRVLPIVMALEPRITISALFQPSYWQGLMLSMGFAANSDEILAKAKELGARVVSPYHLYVTPEFVEKAHAMRLKVIPWTVNEDTRMQELLSMGVDGLISDYPNRLARFKEKRAQ